MSVPILLYCRPLREGRREVFHPPAVPDMIQRAVPNCGIRRRPCWEIRDRRVRNDGVDTMLRPDHTAPLGVLTHRAAQSRRTLPKCRTNMRHWLGTIHWQF